MLLLALARRILLIAMAVLLPLQGVAAAMPSCERDAPTSQHHSVQDSSHDSFAHDGSNPGQTGGETGHTASHLCCSVALPAQISSFSTDAVHAYLAAPVFVYPSFVPNLPQRPPLA